MQAYFESLLLQKPVKLINRDLLTFIISVREQRFNCKSSSGNFREIFKLCFICKVFCRRILGIYFLKTHLSSIIDFFLQKSKKSFLSGAKVSSGNKDQLSIIIRQWLANFQKYVWFHLNVFDYNFQRLFFSTNSWKSQFIRRHCLEFQSSSGNFSPIFTSVFDLRDFGADGIFAFGFFGAWSFQQLLFSEISSEK